MVNNIFYPYALDWGNITLDGFSDIRQEGLFVFNFDLTKKDNIERCIIFCIGKLLWANENIVGNIKYKIIFDFRGQPLALVDRAKQIKSQIENKLKELAPNIIIKIEINI
ncbi:MAG TPA: hypothetical protein VNS32_15610 [Flavisolibacter sp.]|nr:hypothetical protein [Flavisolibacter sp.]